MRVRGEVVSLQKPGAAAFTNSGVGVVDEVDEVDGVDEVDEVDGVDEVDEVGGRGGATLKTLLAPPACGDSVAQ